MPRDPVTDNGCKFSHLQIETAIIPRRNAKRVFIEAHLSAAITGVEPTVQPCLSKEINVRSELRVEKERQSRVEKIVNIAVDESGCWLLEMICLKVDRAA